MAAGLWFELTVAVTAEETVAVGGETDPASVAEWQEQGERFGMGVGPHGRRRPGWAVPG